MSRVKKKSQEVNIARSSPNEYERQRLVTIQANKRKLESLNVKRVAASLTSLVESTNDKRRKTKKKITGDEDYEPANEDYELISDEDDDQLEKEEQLRPIIKKKQAVPTEGRKRNQFIPPLSLANLLKINDRQRREMIEDETLRSAMKVVQKAICSQQHDATEDKIDFDDDDFTNEEFDQLMGYRERGDELDEMDEENVEISQEKHYGEGSGEDDASGNEVHDQVNGDKQIVGVDSQLVTSGKAKKIRGQVYCRKLTALAPGETIFVEFDEDGNPIGDNASMFSYFLGEQVRNRAVFPVQVEGWEDFKSETLDHLWRCVLEKCDFDDPDLRREAVMRHARSLFRDSRHKLKRRYIINPKLTTKEAQLKNKPKDMLKADWKYLVELWRSPKSQERSAKAKESRSFQKMPHYSGTKSHARVKEELKKRNGGECSRVDLLLETRKRKSKNPVNTTSLAYNMHAVDEVSKLKKERDEGLNEKTDDEILTNVLGKDTNGYLRCYGRGKTITQYHGVKPSRLDLVTEVMEAKRATEDIIQEAKREVDDAKKEIERMRKVADDATKEKETIRKEMDAKFEAHNKAW